MLSFEVVTLKFNIFFNCKSTMTHPELISKTISFVKAKLENAEGGHDWFHI